MPSQNSLEKETATHSIILAWKIPWTEESGGLVYGGHKELDTTEQLTLWLSSQSSHSLSALLICFQERWTEFMKKYSVPGWQEVLSKVNPMPGAGRFLETSESTMKCLWSSFAVLYIYIYSLKETLSPQSKITLVESWMNKTHTTVAFPGNLQWVLQVLCKILLTLIHLKYFWHPTF